MTDWKPGDVAIVSFRDAGPYLAFWDDYNEEWVSGTAGRLYPDPARDVVNVRPLVVIDPESADDVERLVRLLPWSYHTDDLPVVAAALREFAAPTPPKPDEPTGLGAVVEDADGNRWLRLEGRPLGPRSWFDVDQGGEDRTYSDIAAVRVLSEGVPQ